MSQLTRSYIGSGAAVVETLTGNTGGAVGPTANNINVVGSGGLTVTGNPGTSTLTISASSINYTYTNVNATPYTVLATDQYLSVDCSGGIITVRLPNTPVLGQAFIIKDRTGSAAANNITVTTPGGATLIDGAATFVMNTAYESINVIGNGTSYEVF
jgi:hypothetical protein